MEIRELRPGSSDWALLEKIGAEDFLGEREGARLWAICNPSPIGVFGFIPHATEPDTVVTQIWVKPAERGKWWTRQFYPQWKMIAAEMASRVLAEVGDNSSAEKLLKSLGWEMYCQDGNLRYYSLTMKQK